MLVTKFLQNQKSHTVEVIFKIQRNIVVRKILELGMKWKMVILEAFGSYVLFMLR